ncbi:MAG TPA: hypothetical protein V6D17_18040 [Candidatus Obscuribacterales bacterium]
MPETAKHITADREDNVADLIAAHDLSCQNRAVLSEAGLCACFFCLSSFQFSRVRAFTDDGLTAVCPCCGIDSVIPDDGTITHDFVRRMSRYWFGTD